MRIVHVIARLNDGGPARVLTALADMLPGVDQWVLHGDCGPGEPDLAPVLGQRLGLRRIPGLGRRLSPTDDLVALFHIRRALAQLRPDVVHTHTAKAGALGRIAAQTLGLRCLHTYHGHVLDGYFPGPVNAVLAAVERGLAGGHHHHALTSSQVVELRDRHGIGRRDRWQALGVPVPPVSAAAPVLAANGVPTVLFLGRLVPVKDGHLWLEVLACLARRQRVRGLVCGTGPERESLERHATVLGLDATFAGQQPAGAALAAADALLMTSRNEGQPLAAVEAALHGVPVVAPPVGGLADLARDGLVQGAARTPEALAQALAQVLGPHRAERIAVGRAAAAALTPAALAPAWLDLYRRVAGLLLLMVLALPGVDLVRIPETATSAGTGEMLTWAVRNGRATSLEVIDPRGGVVVRPAFATVAGTWIRHTPRQPGRHAWRLRQDGAVVASGTLVVTGPASTLPIRISPTNPRLLARGDGTPFLPIGPNLGWVEGDPVAGFTRAFATARQHGCTHLRVWFASWCLPLAGFGEPVNLAAAERIDRVFAAARSAGLVLTVVVDNHQDVLHGPPQDGLTPLKRSDRLLELPLQAAWRDRLAYALARWGADDAVLAWEVMNEPDLLDPRPERKIAPVLAWTRAALGELQRLDVDRRLHVLGWSDVSVAALGALPGLDWVQLHAYVHPGEPTESQVLLQSQDGVELLVQVAGDFGHPWQFGETGYQGTREENVGNDLDGDGMLLTQQLWAGFLLGGTGPAMNWWWDIHIEARGLWPRYRVFADITGTLDWRDPDLVPLGANPRGVLRVLGWSSPRQALIWPHLRADTWHAALLEHKPRPVAAVSQPVRLGGFAAGSFTVESRHPATGDVQDRGTVLVAGDGWLELKFPVGINDRIWVVRRGP